MHIVTDSAADLDRKEKNLGITIAHLRISPVLGVHTGPGVVGALVPISLMEGFE
jgi:fatty acid-binding protein DegV